MSRTRGAGTAQGAAAPAVRAYVLELQSRLRGPSGLKARVVEEVVTDLESAAQKFIARGLGADAAAEAAIDEMGSAKSVADGFADELAVADARRVLRTLLVTGPLVGLWWFLLLAPTGWASRPGELISAIPILPFIAAGVLTAVLALATTGPLIRWLPEASSQRAVLAAVVVGLVCVAGDLVVLTGLAVRLGTGAGSSLPTVLVIIAAAASLIRLPFAIAATSRCVRTRRILHATHGAARTSG